MKQCFLSAVCFLIVAMLPALSLAEYIIHLKDGGQYSTKQYWHEGDQIKFMVSGGVMGFSKSEVKKIVKVEDTATQEDKSPQSAPESDEPAAKQKAAPEIKTPKSAGEKPAKAAPGVKDKKVDIAAYQAEMAKLKDAVNETLVRMKAADEAKDQTAREAAMEDNRKISAQMWQLTNELKEKNNGKLPADWWKGVGQTAPVKK